MKGWEAQVRSKVPPFWFVQLSSATVKNISDLTVVRAVGMAGHLQNGCSYLMHPCTFFQVLPSAESIGLVLHKYSFLLKLLAQLENDTSTSDAIAQPPFQRTTHHTAGDALLEKALFTYWSSKHLLNIF